MWRSSAILTALSFCLLVNCGGGSSSEQAGQSCALDSDCYKGLEAKPAGQIMCMNRVPGGYCTHTCSTDADCCAVKGECRTSLRQVCAPFESTGIKYCFLGCEDTDIGTEDSTAFCQQNAASAFLCRSTGGGSQNRKVCVPN